MMKNRIKMIALAALMGISVTAFAGSKVKGDPRKSAAEKVKKLDAVVELTDEQEQKLTELYLRRQQEMNQQRVQNKEARLEMREEFKNILTPDQLTKLKEHRITEGEKRKAGHMEQMKQELGLSKKQVKQLQELNKSHMERVKAIKDMSEENRRPAMQSERIRHKEEMKKVLTAEQWQKLQEMKKEHRAHHGKGHGHKGNMQD